MKALSIRQPWAWAIFNAGKDIENRDWSMRHRGSLAIHAALGMTASEYNGFISFCHSRGLDEKIMLLPPARELVRGRVIGIVNAKECVTQSSSPWFVGEFGLVLTGKQALSEHIPVRGALGFFEVDIPIDVKFLI